MRCLELITQVIEEFRSQRETEATDKPQLKFITTPKLLGEKGRSCVILGQDDMEQ